MKSYMKLALAGAAMSLFASAALAAGPASKPAAAEAAAPVPQLSEADMKMVKACRNMSAGMRSGTKACGALAVSHPDLLDTSKPLPYIQVATDATQPPPKPAKKGS